MPRRIPSAKEFRRPGGDGFVGTQVPRHRPGIGTVRRVGPWRPSRDCLRDL